MEYQKPNVRALLSRHGLYAKKNYGQNFLVDDHVLSKIVQASGVTKDDFVIEVGAGLGSLTYELCRHAKKVAAFEIDNELLPVLKETLGGFDNLELINMDFLQADIRQLLLQNGETSCKLVANLPYYITTPILFRVFENHLPVSSMTVMVQKEVGERMRAKPNDKSFGALSLSVGYYADAYLAANVPRNCFVPRPDIDSAVMHLTLHQTPPVKVMDEKLLFLLIKAAFSKRRKTLVNGISSFDGLSLAKEAAAAAIADCGFSSDIRGETLSLADFAVLSDAVSKQREEMRD